MYFFVCIYRVVFFLNCPAPFSYRLALSGGGGNPTLGDPRTFSENIYLPAKLVIFRGGGVKKTTL